MKEITRRDAVSMSAAVLALAGCTDAINNGDESEERGDEPTVEPTDESELAPAETLNFGEWSNAPDDVAVTVDDFEIIRGEVPAQVGEDGSNKLDDGEQLVIVDIRAKNISNEDMWATVGSAKRFAVFTGPRTYYPFGTKPSGLEVCEYGGCRKPFLEDLQVRKKPGFGDEIPAGETKEMWWGAATERASRSEISIRYDDLHRFREDGVYTVEWS